MTGRILDPQHWQQLTDLFDRALELDAAGRRELLDTSPPELREELQRLLAADAASGPLDTSGAASALDRMDRALREHGNGDAWIGQRLGPWRIERLLARGGMGRVFLAAREDGEFEQQAALKVLAREWVDDLTRRRFLEERRVLAKLAHPNIARLFDGGLGPDGEPWYAMEYVDGDALTTWCDARELGIAARLDLFRKVCEAVDFAHRHLVIHRDIKPGNILVDAEGEPKLLDFGIAKLLSAQDAQMRSDTRMMTPEYAAPEQLRGDPVSTATDVYALGAVLFELLTGQRAFPDPLAPRDVPSLFRACPTTNPQTAIRAAARATTSTNLRKLLRGDLERILRAALDPDPARRYRGPAALAADLHRHLRGHPISLRRDRGYHFGKFVRRNRISVATGMFAILLLGAAFGFSLVEMKHAREQAHIAGAVRDFMVGVFAGTDPAQHSGAPPDARELLDAGVRRLNLEAGISPQVDAALMHALAKSYAGIGAFDQAGPLAARALDAIELSAGPDSDAAVAARLDYAEILRGTGSQGEARRQARRVLAQTHDAANLFSIRAHVVATGAAIQLGQDAPAMVDAQRALAQAQAIGAIDMQAQIWDMLAQANLGHGDYEAAQHALRRSATLYAHSRGETAMQTLDERDNLEFVLLHSGHVDEALQMFSQQLADERRRLGATHPRVAETLCSYAYVLWSAGHYTQARDIARQATLTLQSATSMPATQRSQSMLNLAIVARLRGDLAGARGLVAQIEQLPQPTGADAQRYLGIVQWLHAALEAESGDAGALVQLRDLQRSQHRLILWPDKLDRPIGELAVGQPQQVLNSYRDLDVHLTGARQRAEHFPDVQLGQAIALVELGHYTEADPLLTSAIAASQQPQSAARLKAAQLWRGWSRTRSGNAAAGLPDIESALAWRRQQFGNDSYRTAEALLAHAEALSRLRHRIEAAREAAQAQTLFAAQLLPTHSLRRRAELPLPR